MAKNWRIVPAAKFKPDAIRGVDGELIHTLKKVRPCRRLVTLGKINRRHIVDGEHTASTNEFLNGRRVIGHYEHYYHATKGWRTRRVAAMLSPTTPKV